MRMGSFGGEFGASHCNQWVLCCVDVQKCVNRWSCSFEVVSVLRETQVKGGWGFQSFSFPLVSMAYFLTEMYSTRHVYRSHKCTDFDDLHVI